MAVDIHPLESELYVEIVLLTPYHWDNLNNVIVIEAGVCAWLLQTITIVGS